MNNGLIRRSVLGLAVVAAASGLWAADHYKVVNGPKDFYFGHISYIEPTPEGTDPVVFRAGAAGPEQGVVNLPIGPGDTVRTSGDRRCEIQFDTGTVVRLDVSTEVRVETIMARSLSALDALSVLTLDRGRVYVMYKEYDRKEMFQILTPNAAVKMKHNSVALITAAADGTTEAQVRYGRAQVLFGPAESTLNDRSVRKGERLMVLADHQSELAAAIEDTAFELWNKDVNAHFDALHEGLTTLPKPIQKLPPAVFYFAQAYGNRYGEWLWDDFYGYVWRPYIDNGTYPWGWSPYFYGRWSYSGGQMFWVPREPWGWIPYHLGVWQWDRKHGWVWLPGSMFAPAWVDWDFYFGYASWRPWSLFDWLIDDPYMRGSDPAWISYFRYMRGGWDYLWPFAGGSRLSQVRPDNVRTIVRKDALKQPAAGSLPIPAELRAVATRVASAYDRGDVRIRESAAAVPQNLVFVAKGDLSAKAVNEKALSWEKVAKPGAPASGQGPARAGISDPRREAARVFRGLDGPAGAPRPGQSMPAKRVPDGRATSLPAASPVRADRAAASLDRGLPTPARFRDWNPDIRVARELGVRIEYSSMSNEVRCPELRLSSRDRERATYLTPRMTSGGVAFGPATAGGGSTVGSTSSGSTGSTSTSSSRGQAERSSASSGSQSSKTAGEGGKIKN